MTPLWQHDRTLSETHACLAGVDEAGRGALAGPVVAAVVCIEREFFSNANLKAACAGITDSKQVKPQRREAIFEQLHAWRDAGHLCFAAAEANVAEIAELNILGATRLAMQRALESLPYDLPTVEAEAMPLFNGESHRACPVHILVDGRPLKPFPYVHQHLIKGDGKSLSIAAASIIAKVTRDRAMVALDSEFPGYGFAGHKGYGTEAHRAAILKNGPAACHRAKFLEKILP